MQIFYGNILSKEDWHLLSVVTKCDTLYLTDCLYQGSLAYLLMTAKSHSWIKKHLYMHNQCSWHQRQHLFKIGIKWCKNTRENIMSQQASNPPRFWIPTASVRFTKNLSATPPSLLGEIFTREKWCSNVPTTGHWYNIEIISEIDIFQTSPWRRLFETN